MKKQTMEREARGVRSGRRLTALGLLLASTAVLAARSAEAQVTQFEFWRKGERLGVLHANRLSQAQDNTVLDKVIAAGMTRRRDIEKQEEVDYKGTGYTPVANNTKLNGYLIRLNEAHSRQNCAGLALARFIGGPYTVDPGKPDQEGGALKLLNKIGYVLPADKEPEPWDIAVFINGGVAQHMALVKERKWDGSVEIFSKDNWERVYQGLAHYYPRYKRGDTGLPVYYRVDWDTIDVRHVGEPEIVVPPARGSIDWGKTAPRVQKTLVEAAESALRAAELPVYQGTGRGELRWEWDEGDVRYVAWITVGDLADYGSKFAREHLKSNMEQLIAAGWGYQRFSIPALPEEVAYRRGLFNDFAGMAVSEHQWTAGRHRLEATLQVHVPKSGDAAAKKRAAAEALQVATHMGEVIFRTLLTSSVANELEKPLRPRDFFPFDKTSPR